jgi:choice-of-anchor C domain-containing protein
MILVRSVIVLAVFSLGAAPAASQSSLVTNGDFEEMTADPCPGTWVTLPLGDTSIAGWTIVQDSVDFVCPEFWTPSHGQRSLDLGGLASGGIGQTISTIAGTRYEVRFDLAGNPLCSPTVKTMRVSADGQFADFTFDVTGRSQFDMGWTTQTWSFVADDGAALLTFISQDDPSSSCGPALDNVSVTTEDDDPPGGECFSTHVKGTGPTRAKVCFSREGTIASLEWPAGFEHLAGGPSGEGYAVCSASGVHGFEAGVANDGFAAPIVTQPKGPNTLPLTIARTTLDGQLQLTQTYAFDPIEHDVTITMTLKNVSAVRLTNVRLVRYAHGALDNGAGAEAYDKTGDSVFARDTRGVAMTALTFATPHLTAVEAYEDWTPLPAGGTARGCDPLAQTTPTLPGNFVGRLTYDLGILAAGKSKAVKVVYRRF